MRRSVAKYVCLFVLTISPNASPWFGQVSGKTYARVLLPIVLKEPTPGENGSLWATELTLANTSETSASVFTYAVNGGLP